MINKTGPKSINKKQIKTAKKETPSPKKSLLLKKNKPGLKDSATLRRPTAKQRKSENADKYRSILENIQDGCFEVDLASNFTFFNDSVCRILGYTRKELKHMNSRQFTDKDDVKKVFQAYKKVWDTGKPLKDFCWKITRKDGTKRYVEGSISLRKDSSGKPTGFLGIANDITERKRMEEALKESELKFRTIFESASDGILLAKTSDRKFFTANEKICKMLGYTENELVKLSIYDIHPEESLPYVIDQFEKQFRKEILIAHDIPVMKKDKTVFFVDVNSTLITIDRKECLLGMFRDITERRLAEDALRESEEKFRVLADSTPTAIMLYQDDRWIYANRATEIICGYSVEELLNMNFWDIVHPDHKALIQERGQKRQRGEEVPSGYEFKIIAKDGTVKWVYLSGASTMLQGKPAAIISVLDITDRKRAEKNLLDSEERYRVVVENAHESILITDELKVVFANSAAADNTGYSIETLTAGDFTKFIHPDDINMVNNYHIRRLNGEEVPPVYSFRIICRDGTVKWAELNATVIQWEKKPATLSFLKDITERRLLDEERNENFKRTKETLDATVNSIAMIVETRDPYTTGHQLRVSHLAQDIAAEMGLTTDQKEFIGTAAIIHDIGKLSIPSEILSKPTKLTVLEFELIKTHSQSGYNILKDINFPWPVATVILQHHERMNGSGYPQKLKGDDILLEARIVALADVVEAISSHRPYRAALGIIFAMDEISKNRGILYDANVVDACLRLFQNKNYVLS